ncbi:MAG TPA: SRPBCC domain-containing protein [Myxococcales bacterium]|nr:SRPBCC domain-containing protein [Myxococcales bacterium]
MSEDTLVQEITIEAPAERVFDALAQPEQRLAWWGRTGRFRTTRMESDLRAGGAWTMWFETPHGPATVGGVYRAVERPRLLAFTWRPSWYDAQESLVTIELAETGGVTKVRLTHSGLTGAADRASNAGWPDLLAALRGYLAGK